MNGQKQPVIHVSRSRLEHALQGISIAGILGMGVILWHYWPQLPASVPIHFGASGQPDGWGSKGVYLALAAVALALYALMTMVAKVPHRFNYLVKITAENATRQYQLACSLMAGINALTVIAIAFVLWQVCEVAVGRAVGIGLLFLPVLLGALAAVTIAYFVMARRLR